MRWIIAAFALGAALWIAADNEAAMRACQVRHSFDTCHHALHR